MTRCMKPGRESWRRLFLFGLTPGVYKAHRCGSGVYNEGRLTVRMMGPIMKEAHRWGSGVSNERSSPLGEWGRQSLRWSHAQLSSQPHSSQTPARCSELLSSASAPRLMSMSSPYQRSPSTSTWSADVTVRTDIRCSVSK